VPNKLHSRSFTLPKYIGCDLAAKVTSESEVIELTMGSIVVVRVTTLLDNTEHRMGKSKESSTFRRADDWLVKVMRFGKDLHLVSYWSIVSS